MPYKTISIKLLKPTKIKEQILLDALERYSKAFTLILEELEKKDYKKIILNKEVMKVVNDLKVEPFKDSLKIDIAMLLSTYSKTYCRDCGIKAPKIRTQDSDLKKHIINEINLKERAMNKLINKYNNLRPILFCRYSINRDYSILLDEKSNKYYLKLYLFNRSDSKFKEIYKEKPLKYLGEKDKYLEITTKKVRYELFPLQVGPWQEQHLKHIMEGKLIPKSGIIIKKDHNFYFNMRIYYEEETKLDCSNYLGVSRGISCELFYVVCNSEKKILKQGEISFENINGNNKIHHLANRIINLAIENKSTIIIENLVDRKDKLRQNEFIVPMSIGSYNLMANYLSYKCELKGLSSPIKVSPTSIFYRCPKCNVSRLNNRFGNDKFLCVNCGYTENLEFVGAYNLSTTLIKYDKNQFIIHYKRNDGYITFKFKPLNLEFKCEDNEFAIKNFCVFFMDSFQKPKNKLSKIQQSILYKLNKIKDLEGSFKYIEE